LKIYTIYERERSDVGEMQHEYAHASRKHRNKYHEGKWEGGRMILLNAHNFSKNGIEVVIAHEAAASSRGGARRALACGKVGGE